MSTRKIGWIDSCGQPSRVHKTVDGIDTICGGHADYIANRRLAVTPKKHSGHSRFCRRCFSSGGKSLPWDSRCSVVEWNGPASAPSERSTK